MTAPRRGQQAALQPSDAVLPSIPVVETRPGFPLATLLPCKERAHALLHLREAVRLSDEHRAFARASDSFAALLKDPEFLEIVD